MTKIVAVYRTAYPLPSEAFIPSQLLGLMRYQPLVWCRDFHGSDNPQIKVKSVFADKPASVWRKVLFTFFGIAGFKDDVQLVHAHFGPDAAMILPLVKRSNLPLVVTFHGFDAQQSRWSMLKSKTISNWLFLLREKMIYRYASRIIAVSAYLRECLIRRGCPPDKLIVHYIGVDTSRFKVDSAARIPKRLVNVSRHVDWKGIDTILLALPQLIVQYPDLVLVQIGSGPDTRRLQQLAVELGVSEHVHWRGALPHEQVLAELRQASVYVHAARTDEKGQTEAFGIALIEAQACGVPVVATRSGGIPEAMLENHTGLLFEENDHAALAAQLDSLLSDGARLDFLANNAREFVVSRFDINVQSAKLENIYDEIGS
ncbi:glycosyltransferase [Methylomonas sp. EFPC3]|uniref:glycosyltransferase n=1 Tax=Methylomonas sp. EFPC3 TaxID=3021710 RepID=UPI00241712E2|nr:glycosyltransferase [Methylomonas sp. EFPC3]WFP49540.1 glycosyltransferase [Methylomonas sp. EFPC3]